MDVLAIDLDAREREIGVMPPVVAELARGSRVFLKIDSTLRGPVASLIESALRVTGRSAAMVAPAFPEQGRVVRGGRLYVNGEAGPLVSDVIGDHRVVETDLGGLVQESESHPEWLLVGSAGLARQLAPRSTPRRMARHAKVLVVAGSPSQITREQVAQLRGVEVLNTPPTRGIKERDEGQMAEALADEAAQKRPDAVVLTGGATARAVIHRVAARHVRILGELQPGIPVGVLEDGTWHGVTVVTKAGGFGSPSTLLDVVRALSPS